MLRRITLVLTLCGLMAPVLVAQNAPVNTRVYISLYNVRYGDIPEYTAFYEANTRPILESMVYAPYWRGIHDTPASFGY